MFSTANSHLNDDEQKLDPSKTSLQLEYQHLTREMNYKGHRRLGYPTSSSPHHSLIDYKLLGIAPGSLAALLMNNVGDPTTLSETYQMELKKYEIKVLQLLAQYFGLPAEEGAGYITGGATEANFACLWWAKRYLRQQRKMLIKEILSQIEGLSRAIALPFTPAAVKAELIIQRDQYKNNLEQLLTPTLFCTDHHTHYCAEKICHQFLNVHYRPVRANTNGSMNMQDFKQQIEKHMQSYPLSPIMINVNVGTTVLGATDDVIQIRQVLSEIEQRYQRKLNYTIHIDGALNGILLPILQPFGTVQNYLHAIGVCTIALSGHKFLGMSQPSGIAFTTKAFLTAAVVKEERAVIKYIGNIPDITITGSRSGLNALYWDLALRQLGLDQNNRQKLTEKVMLCRNNAFYLVQRLKIILGESAVYYNGLFNVVFSKPSPALIKKYQLMVEDAKAVICVLNHVTQESIDEFIVDLMKEQRMHSSAPLLQASYTAGLFQPVHQPLTHFINSRGEKITFTTLLPQYIESAAAIFAEAFCGDEPTTKALGVTEQEFLPFALHATAKAAADGLGVVALDEKGNVIGCVIAEDLADPLPPLPERDVPKLQPIFAFLEQLGASELQVTEKGKVAHAWVTAITKDHMGTRLSVPLNDACVVRLCLQKKGFLFVYSEFTSELNEKYMLHINKKYPGSSQLKLGSACYADFQFAGQRPFAKIPGNAAAYIYTTHAHLKIEEYEKYIKRSTPPGIKSKL